MEGDSEQKPLNLRRVFSETRRVIKSQNRTFLALAFLFFFPSSLAAVLYPLAVKSLSGNKTPAKIILSVAYYLFGVGFSPFGIASITYTALHGFNGNPVKVKNAVKSIAASYFPLLSVHLIVFFITLGFALVVIVLGLAASPYHLGFALAIFIFVTLYLQANWMLSGAVVVAESSWGFSPLKRSKILIEGKRGIALCLKLIFTLYCLVFFWSNYYTTEYAASLGSASRPSTAAEWRSFIFKLTFQFLYTAVFVTMIHLYSVIASVVLYVHCRDIERAGGDHTGEYFSLLADDDKVATLV